ncbi:DUF1304 domain-containing protein [Chloroflexia bacterium SDU3-3]|nr:DUF1304 domain-containing protein [Chloroflexia bacterium SDU3-3]
MLTILAQVFAGLVALEHCYILYLEMFAWTQPRTMRSFGLTPEQAAQTKAMAANQGLYNGFLAAGLVWGLLHPDPAVGAQIRLFFLGCVLVAAVYGSLTAKRSILWVQGGPAAVALLLALLA